MKTFGTILPQICMSILWHNHITGRGWMQTVHAFYEWLWKCSTHSSRPVNILPSSNSSTSPPRHIIETPSSVSYLNVTEEWVVVTKCTLMEICFGCFHMSEIAVCRSVSHCSIHHRNYFQTSKGHVTWII